LAIGYYSNKTGGGYWYEIDPGIFDINKGSTCLSGIDLRIKGYNKRSGIRSEADLRSDAAKAPYSFYFAFGPAFFAISPDGRFLYACCGASPWGIDDPNQDKTVVGVLDLHDMMVIRQVRVRGKRKPILPCHRTATPCMWWQTTFYRRSIREN